MRSHTKLIHICLSTDDGTCIFELLDDGGIVGAGEILKNAGGTSGLEIEGTYIIFDRYSSTGESGCS